jgi:hypothetical protein
MYFMEMLKVYIDFNLISSKATNLFRDCETSSLGFKKTW